MCSRSTIGNLCSRRLKQLMSQAQNQAAAALRHAAAKLRHRIVIPALAFGVALGVNPGVALAQLNELTTFGSAGSGAGQLAGFSGIGQGVAVNDTTGTSTSGDVYVTDTGNNRIEQFNANGQFIRAWGWGVEDAANAFETCTSTCQAGISGSGAGQIGSASGIAVDNAPGATQGDVYVADNGNDAVETFSPSGAYLSEITGPSATTQFGAVSSVAVDSSGNVWVADQAVNTIYEFSPAGSLISQFATGYGVTYWITVDNDGDVYASSGDSQIEEWTPASMASGPSGGTLIDDQGNTGLAIDPSTNDLYDDRASSIAEYGPTGTLLGTFGTGDLNLGVGLAYNPNVTVSGASTAGALYVIDATIPAVAVFIPVAAAAPFVGAGSETATSVAAYSGTLNATVNPDGEDTKYYFEYVDAAAYNPSAPDPYSAGTQIPLPPGADIGSAFGPDAESVNLTGLTPTTLYHFRVVATNSLGTTYGPDATFSTQTAAAPSVDSSSATSVTADSATLNAQINPNYGDTTYYFEYVSAAAYDPTASDPYSAGTQIPAPPGTDIGSANTDQAATVNLTGMVSGTVYHFRVVAINALGTTDGTDQTFTTLIPMAPSVDSEAWATPAPGQATLSAEINPNLADTTYYFEFVSAASYNPSASDPYSAGTQVPTPPGTDIGSESTDQPASATVSGVTAGVTYHFRVVAINEINTTYGADQEFTVPLSPVAYTGSATALTQTTATLGGFVNPFGLDTSYWFDYGTSTKYGSFAPAPDGDAGSGEGLETVTAAVTGLAPNTVYHYQLVAVDAAGLSVVGDDETFQTLPNTATIQTSAASAVTDNSATLNGSVNPNGSPTTYWFQYGVTTAYGSSEPGNGAAANAGNSAQTVSESIGGLLAGVTYHYRLVAQNAGGTAYGADGTFTTVPQGGCQASASCGVTSATVTLPARGAFAGKDATLTLGCTGEPGASCAGKVTLKARLKIVTRAGGKVKTVTRLVVVGTVQFSVSAGKTSTIAIRVSTAARTAWHGAKVVQVIGSARQPALGAPPVVRAIKLRHTRR